MLRVSRFVNMESQRFIRGLPPFVVEQHLRALKTRGESFQVGWPFLIADIVHKDAQRLIGINPQLLLARVAYDRKLNLSVASDQ